MRRREFLMLPFLGLLGCVKEEIKPVRAARLLSTFNGAPTPPGPSYSTEYQAVLDKALVLGTVWTSTTQSTSPSVRTMDGASLVQLGNFVYLIGGWNEVTSPRAQNTVYMCSVNDLTSWSQLSDAPWAKRHSFGCEVLNNQIFIWGADIVTGDSSHDCWSATQNVSTGELTWTLKCATLPYSPRCIFGACKHNNELYTLGGESYTSETPPTDVWKSSDGITWTKVGDGVAAFGGNFAGGLQSFNGSLYTVGGGRYYAYPSGPNYGTHTYINTIYKSIDNGVNWSAISAVAPYTLHYTRLVVFDNKLWALIGVNSGTTPFYLGLDEVVVTPTITNTYWTTNWHAIAGYKITVNGTDYLAAACGTKTTSNNYFLTIAKSYSGYDAPSTTQKGYQDTLMGLLKTNSWLTGTGALKCFYAFNYGSSGFSTINWVDPTLYILTRNNTPTWTDGAGFSGNSSNMWLQPTSLNPSALSNISESNCSIFAYVKNEMAQGLFAIFGGSPSSNSASYLYLAPRYNSTQMAVSMYGSAGDAIASQTSSSIGLWHVTRTGTTNYTVYRDRVLVGTITSTADATKFANKLSILSGISSGATRFSNAQLSCFGFGPAIDNTALNDVWDAYKLLAGL